jgi:hypothetical protein
MKPARTGETSLRAIRSEAEVPGEPAVADALAAAIASQLAREWVAARKRKQEETEAASRQEEVPICAVRVELRGLRTAEPEMSLLAGVEFITPDPAHRIALYRRRSAEDQSISGMGEDDARLLTNTSTHAKDLALLKRGAQAEGFQV